MRTILYTNQNTGKCIWQCEKYHYESYDENDFVVMSNAHCMLNESKDKDFVEGIRLLLKSNGTLISRKE